MNFFHRHEREAGRGPIQFSVANMMQPGVFDIDNPDLNLVTPDGIDYIGEVTLQAGVSYKLVVQQWCVNREGAWALTFTGPGEVDSSQAVTMPDLTEGRFAASDPVASTVGNLWCQVDRQPLTHPRRADSTFASADGSRSTRQMRGHRAWRPRGS